MQQGGDAVPREPQPPWGGYPAGGPNTGTAWGPYWWVRDTVGLGEEARGEWPGSG